MLKFEMHEGDKSSPLTC